MDKTLGQCPGVQNVYLCLLPLFLPFGALFRHGSCSGGSVRVARSAPPSKRDARETREQTNCLASDFLWTIVSLPLSYENITFFMAKFVCLPRS